MRYLLLGLALWAGVGRAESGADALLNSVDATLSVEKGSPTETLGKKIQLTDPFLLQFFTAWQAEPKLPYEVNAWAMRILRGEYTDAAHLWSAIKPLIPPSFEATAQGGYLYLLWKLKLAQAFFDHWVATLGNPRLLEARILSALELTIQAGFDTWLVDNAISVTPAQEAVIKGIDTARGMHVSTLRAYLALRRPEEALPLLAKLPPTHRLKIPLTQTVALDLARKPDLKAAAHVLKVHLEPAVEAAGKPTELSRYYLQVARLLYQAQALDVAATFYERIPRGAAEYLAAREELLWVWLRQGETAKVRGALTTLQSDLFRDRFAPDASVVLAISNLKLCYYDAVKATLERFIREYEPWAKRLEEAIAAAEPPVPASPDEYSRLALRMMEKRDEETKRLTELGEKSVGAALPAVGPQPHWEGARKEMQSHLESAKKRLHAEYRRQWRNQRLVLEEAIRKMRFVKVEFLSQIRQLGAEKLGRQAESDKKTLGEVSESMVFPYDGVVWADEMFKLRSAALSYCPETKP